MVLYAQRGGSLNGMTQTITCVVCLRPAIPGYLREALPTPTLHTHPLGASRRQVTHNCVVLLYPTATHYVAAIKVEYPIYLPLSPSIRREISKYYAKKATKKHVSRIILDKV